MVAKAENSTFFKIYKSHSIPVMISSNFCRCSNEMRLFLRKNRSFYGKESKICKVLVIFKGISVMLLQVLLLYSDCFIHTKVKKCQYILFGNEVTKPIPFIFVQNRSHQGVNMSDLFSDFK